MRSALKTETLRVGLLSFAHRYHATSYTRVLTQTPGVEVAALYDDDPERGQTFARQFGVPDFYSTPDALLTRDDIQAVVVCSPTSEHAALVTAAARASKHVLCEKPIATTWNDARAMIEACRVNGVQLHLAFVCRFYPMVQKAKAMIASGEIGPVRGILGGNRGTRPTDSPPWITDPVQAGGGALIDHSVHVTDAMRYVLGSEVESVFAETGRLIRPELSVEDCAQLLIKFRNGATASVDPSWSISAHNPYHYDFYLHILGAEGWLSIDDRRQALNVVSEAAADRNLYIEPFGAAADVDAAMVRHFLQCIRQGQATPPYASGEDGLRALEIALAAYQSALLGQPVPLEMDTP
jgi:predicted dehydrogenase